MSNNSITLDEVRDEIQLTIDDIVRLGAQRMLAAALEAEVEAYLARHGQKDEQGRAKSQLHEIMLAPHKRSAEEELKPFQGEFEAKYPKAVNGSLKDADRLFTFMVFPGAHWAHRRTTNAIESTFATVKARTRVTNGAGSREAVWPWPLS